MKIILTSLILLISATVQAANSNVNSFDDVEVVALNSVAIKSSEQVQLKHFSGCIFTGKPYLNNELSFLKIVAMSCNDKSKKFDDREIKLTKDIEAGQTLIIPFTDSDFKALNITFDTNLKIIGGYRFVNRGLRI